MWTETNPIMVTKSVSTVCEKRACEESTSVTIFIISFTHCLISNIILLICTYITKNSEEAGINKSCRFVWSCALSAGYSGIFTERIYIARECTAVSRAVRAATRSHVATPSLSGVLFFSLPDRHLSVMFLQRHLSLPLFT